MWHTRRGNQRSLQPHKRVREKKISLRMIHPGSTGLTAATTSCRALLIRNALYISPALTARVHYRQLRNKNATGDKRKIAVENKRKIINPCIVGSIFAKLPLKCQSTARSIWSVRITFYLDSAQMMSSPALVCLSVGHSNRFEV